MDAKETQKSNTQSTMLFKYEFHLLFIQNKGFSLLPLNVSVLAKPFYNVSRAFLGSSSLKCFLSCTFFSSGNRSKVSEREVTFVAKPFLIFFRAFLRCPMLIFKVFPELHIFRLRKPVSATCCDGSDRQLSPDLRRGSNYPDIRSQIIDLRSEIYPDIGSQSDTPWKWIHYIRSQNVNISDASWVPTSAEAATILISDLR